MWSTMWPSIPASHYITPTDKLEEAIREIEREMEGAGQAYFEEEGKLIEAQRIKQRTTYDMEMLQEIGFCKRHRELFPGAFRQGARLSPSHACWTISPRTFLMFIDESHVTHAPGAGDVPWRPGPEGNAGGLWFPPALGL